MDYSTYRLSAKEIGKALLLAALIGLCTGYLFYDVFWGILFLPIIFCILSKLIKKKRMEENRQLLTGEFCEMLKTLEASLVGGYSLERAFLEAERELHSILGENSMIYKELHAMNARIAMNESLEEVFMEFANRTGVDEIQLFAEVLAFAKRTGGNLVDILETSIDRIQVIWDTEKEIDVLVASKRYEQKIMMVLPLLILFYLKLSFREYLSVLYGNVLGGSFMTLCILIYLTAVLWGQRLLKITV